MSYDITTSIKESVEAAQTRALDQKEDLRNKPMNCNAVYVHFSGIILLHNELLITLSFLAT
jgi:hypothetical protein